MSRYAGSCCMSYSSAKLRTTLRKAGWAATPPVSVSPWISTCTRAAASRPRNSLPLRAAIPGRYRQCMAARQGPPGSLAARVTYLLEPKNWLIVTVVGVGAHADGLAGAGWGLLAAFFAAVLPTVFIAYGIRRGRWEDRNVGDRRPRLVVLAFITASVATALILLAVLGAPALLTGYLAFMLPSVAVLAAITLVWKSSIHCAVAAGSVTILALVYGPLVLGGYLLVGLLGWARVAVRDHSVPQVVAGSVLGAAAAFAAYAAIVALSSLSNGSC